MNTGGIEFKKFKHDFHSKNVHSKINMNKLPQAQVQVHNQIQTKIKQQYSHISPQKKPTTFRQLSGSRQKNKIFSGKKAALQNKLNTLRSNQKCSGFDTSNDQLQRNRKNQMGSAKKQGLFTRLLTSRSPCSNKNGGLQDISKTSSNGTMDNSGISFSAFKGVSVAGQNQNNSNIVLQKTVSSDQEKQKGLKFKGFPHKRGNINNQKTPNNPVILLNKQGPLILQKGRSHSKNKKLPNQLQKTRSPLKNIILNPAPQYAKKYSAVQNYQQNEYGLKFSRQQSQEVIRSREGSMVFDMSPTIC